MDVCSCFAKFLVIWSSSDVIKGVGTFKYLGSLDSNADLRLGVNNVSSPFLEQISSKYSLATVNIFQPSLLSRF